MKVINRDSRPRPKLVTPRKGSLGDLTIESLASGTSIDSILARYGGNLAEFVSWRKGEYKDNTEVTTDLVEAFNKLIYAKSFLEGTPYPTLEDAVAAIHDGSFSLTPNTETMEGIVNNETQENIPSAE